MVRTRLWDAGLVVVAVAITVLNSGFAKPIWIDEYLHFVMGSLSFREALSVIAASTGDGVNWGQTGTYLLLDYFLGSLFGANLWALRAPSIFSGFVLLMAATWFIRQQGLNRFWQFAALLALGSQWTLMHYVGEARPYLPMAASVVAMLAFYITPPQNRHGITYTILGLFGLMVGAAMHPYWLPYAIFVIAFSLWLGSQSGEVNSRSQVLRFLRLPILLPSLVVYFILAALTWLGARSSFKTNPWEYLGDLDGLIRTLTTTHIDFISPPPAVNEVISRYIALPLDLGRLIPVSLVITLTIGATLPLDWAKVLRQPMALLWGGIISSIAISLLSLLNDYWIIQRQWLGGIALVAVAFVWGLGRLWTSEDSPKSLKSPVALIAVSLMSLQFTRMIDEGVNTLNRHSEAFASFSAERAAPKELVEAGFASNDPVFPANVNIARGGVVWREHSRYYESLF